MYRKAANLFILVCVIAQFCFGNLLLAKAQVASQQLVLPSSSDTFVSTSSSNPNNGGRRFLPIGSYRDYTLPGSPLFASSRALLDFGTVNLPSNAIVQSAKLQLYHYGTNTGDEAFFVSLVSSGWNESTVWPGPSSTGDFGSVNLANYNSSSTAVLREIPLNHSIVASLRTTNQGLLLRNYDEAAPGVVVCSRNIPSGPCHAGMEPKLVIDYFLNTAPSPTELGNPDMGWQLGPASAYQGVSCDTTGTGLGCDVSFNTRGTDPDDSFPLTTAVEISRSQGGNANYNYAVSHENWYARSEHLADGNWTWRARTSDTHGAVGGWSVSKSFVVDTTAPSQPELLTEPEYSPGTQNTIVSTISTDALIGSVSYEFQISQDPTFTTIVASSGWIDTAEFTFATLENEQEYYYRVRARDQLANTTGWSASVSSQQDAVLPLLQNLALSEQVISPKNADGTRDSSELSFDVVETHMSGTTVKMQNIATKISR